MTGPSAESAQRKPEPLGHRCDLEIVAKAVVAASDAGTRHPLGALRPGARRGGG